MGERNATAANTVVKTKVREKAKLDKKGRSIRRSCDVLFRLKNYVSGQKAYKPLNLAQRFVILSKKDNRLDKRLK